MNSKILILFASLIAGSQSPLVHAGQTPIGEMVELAITQFEQTNRKDWSFQVSRYENEEGDISQSTESFSPSLPVAEQWQLITIDGGTPSDKQKDKYRRNKLKQEGESLNLRIRELVIIDTLQIVSETEEALTASFNVQLDRLGDKASKKLTGLLTYNVVDSFISQIEITNLAAFSPVLTANITDFKLTLRFQKIGEAILPLRQDMNMSGTFAFFTKIEEVSRDTFSDFVYVGSDEQVKISD